MDYRQSSGNIKCNRKCKELTFTAEYASERPAVSLYGRSITLKDNIDVNYYMEMSDSVFEHDAYLEFKIGGQTYRA